MCSIVWLEVDARRGKVVTASEGLIEAEDLASRRKPVLWDHLVDPTKERRGYRKVQVGRVVYFRSRR